MPFNSIPFAVLCCVSLTAYWALARQPHRLLVLLAASLIFYGWSHPPSLLILLGSIGFNFVCGRWLEREKRRSALALAVGANLALLCWYKFLPFAWRELRALAGLWGFSFAEPIAANALPLGISFFTFQVIAYQVDVWRGEVRAERSLRTFAVFKSFFAQLIAGPIVRAKEFLPQLHEFAKFDAARFQQGLYTFVVGLWLKTAIADVLRQFADQAFGRPELQTTTEAWLGLFAYSLQIFADFWGYSTMAVGLGLLFGLRLPVNFDTPYLSASPQEFWRCWHMTLSSWLREYLYIPLGGNRRHALFNLVLTMTLAGLWHGAGWTFVLWGLCHGLWLALHRGLAKIRPPRAMAVTGTFLTVTLLWVLFRADSLAQARSFYARLFLPPYNYNIVVPETQAIWLVTFFALHPVVARTLSSGWGERTSPFKQALLTAAMLLMSLAYAGQHYDFVYFAF